MTVVELSRVSDAPPPMRELLRIEADGTFRAWRSVGEVVGRFGGRVPDPDALRRLAEATLGSEPPATTGFPADATIDELAVDGRSLAVTIHDRPAGPWGALLTACRELLGSLMSHPDAAIAGVLPGTDRVRLEHRGRGVVPIELGAATIVARTWSDTALIDQALVETPDVRHVDAGPGWSLEIPLPALGHPPGTTLAVDVSFVADDGGVLVPVVVRPILKVT